MNKQEILKEEMKALLDKYGYEAKIELTEKKRSLRLVDIVKAQHGGQGYYIDDYGVRFCQLSGKIETILDEQIKESSAKKCRLFGQIQRIADYANGDWVADWNNEEQAKYVPVKKDDGISIDLHISINFGMPPIKSLELYRQAYNDNQAIFDEFFKL